MRPVYETIPALMMPLGSFGPPKNNSMIKLNFSRVCHIKAKTFRPPKRLFLQFQHVSGCERERESGCTLYVKRTYHEMAHQVNLIYGSIHCICQKIPYVSHLDRCRSHRLTTTKQRNYFENVFTIDVLLSEAILPNISYHMAAGTAYTFAVTHAVLVPD